MSSASKFSLAATSLFAAGVIVFVHFQQKAEQTVCLYLYPPLPSSRHYLKPLDIYANAITKAMHAGVVRDIEQQRIKRERQLDFDMQKALEEEYKREQSVHSSLEPLSKASAGSR